MHRHTYRHIGAVGATHRAYCIDCPAQAEDWYDGLSGGYTRVRGLQPPDDLRIVAALMPAHMGLDLPRFLDARLDGYRRR